MSKSSKFLTAAVAVFVRGEATSGKEVKMTDCYFTFKGRNFVSRRMGYLDDAVFDEEVQRFLAIAEKEKHAMELLTPVPWPRDVNTFAESAARSRAARAETAQLRHRLMRVKTAILDVVQRSEYMPGESDQDFAASLSGMLDDMPHREPRA